MDRKYQEDNSGQVLAVMFSLVIIALIILAGIIMYSEFRYTGGDPDHGKVSTRGSIVPHITFTYEHADSTGRNITFELVGADDLALDRNMLMMDLGDGGPFYYPRELVFVHRYPTNGTYDARLLYLDERNDPYEIWYCNVKAHPFENSRPVAQARLDRITIGLGDQPVLLSGEGSYDVDGSIIGYCWIFGDGTRSDMSVGIHGFYPGMVTSHTYVLTGHYTAYLYVIDDQLEVSRDPCKIEIYILTR